MNYPLIANIIVFVVLLFVLAQARHKQLESGKKSTGRSGHGCGVWPRPAHHLWFRQPCS